MNSNIPNSSIIVNENDAPWMTTEIKTFIKRKHKIYQKYRRTKSLATYDTLKTLQNSLKTKIDEAKHIYTQKLVNNLNDANVSDKTFWSAYNKFLNKKKPTNIPPIEDNDSFISCFQKKAEMFNNYFCNLCSLPNDDNIVPLVPSTTNSNLNNFTVDVNSISCIIQKLKIKKASGPDGISAHMLKLCPTEMANILYHLFNKILHEDKFPDAWKMACTACS